MPALVGRFKLSQIDLLYQTRLAPWTVPPLRCSLPKAEEIGKRSGQLYAKPSMNMRVEQNQYLMANSTSMRRRGASRRFRPPCIICLILLSYALSTGLLPCKALARNSAQTIVNDMSLGPDAALHGVPAYYSWTSGAASPQPMPVPARNNLGEWFQAMTACGQVYIPASGNSATNTRFPDYVLANPPIGPPVTPVLITNWTMAANRTSFTVSGSGMSNRTHVLLAATNLAQVTWLQVVTNSPSANGVFSFTDRQITNASRRFYRVLAR